MFLIVSRKDWFGIEYLKVLLWYSKLEDVRGLSNLVGIESLKGFLFYFEIKHSRCWLLYLEIECLKREKLNLNT
jgi:hypothetical protein